VLVLCALIAVAVPGHANGQDQESKLVDRLLKPNATLQNSAQNKKFTFASATVSKPANVGTFYIHQKPAPKVFAGARDFSTREANSRSFNGANKSALSSPPVPLKSERVYTAWRANAAGVPWDAPKVSRTGEFSGKRPFLDPGKSQKSLDRQNPPMTIEQVRELLNKNK
jgi:hypothetical protein